jgi:hypothetical protein
MNTDSLIAAIELRYIAGVITLEDALALIAELSEYC